MTSETPPSPKLNSEPPSPPGSPAPEEVMAKTSPAPRRLARVSLSAFLLPLTALPALALLHFFIPVSPPLSALFLVSFSLVFLVLGKVTEGEDGFAVWWRALLIGTILLLGIYISFMGIWGTFGWYVVVMAVFHFTEYLATALTNPNNLSTDSFLLNHSPAYHIAAVASWAEFFLEFYFAPVLKSVRAVSYLGLCVCLLGEVVRKLAMAHAGRSFSHIVQSVRKEDHVLVTDGIYRFSRHPSYVGWFYWSIGTQVILCNPVCFLGYLLTSWFFFRERIAIEEESLLYFFGDAYANYKRTVPTGLPFISGCDLRN